MMLRIRKLIVRRLKLRLVLCVALRIVLRLGVVGRGLGVMGRGRFHRRDLSHPPRGARCGWCACCRQRCKGGVV